MGAKTIITGVLLDDSTKLSYEEVCQKFNFSEDVLTEMIEYGLFSPQTTDLEAIQFDQKTLDRIQTAYRLQHDLEINLPGVVLILDLLEELASTREELSILQHQLDNNIFR